MLETVSESDHAAFVGILNELESGWNAGDEMAFTAAMAEDADFITIRADHLRGRRAIVASHAGIFATFYAGSRNSLRLESARLLGEDVALLHVRSVLEAPTGPLAGRHEATISLVLLRKYGKWQITSFHITLASPTPPHT